MERATPKPPGHRHLTEEQAHASLKKAGVNRHDRRRAIALAKREQKKKNRGV